MQQAIQPRKKALGYLGTFFAVMLVLTLLATTLTSISVAQVEFTMPQRTPLIHVLESQGIITSGSEIPLFIDDAYVQSGIYVDSVQIHQGDRIEAGDPVIILNMAQLRLALQKAEGDLKKQQLLNEQSNIETNPKTDNVLKQEEAQKNSEITARTREENLQAADEAVLIAEEDLSNAIKALGDAKEKLSALQKTASEDASKSYTESLKAAEDSVDQTSYALGMAQDNRSQTLLISARAVEDCQEAVLAAQKAYDSTPDEPSQKALDSAKKGLQRAQQDYNIADSNSLKTVSKTQQDYTTAQNAVAKIEENGTSPYYNNGPIEAAKAEIFQAEENITNCVTALEKAKKGKEEALAKANDEIQQEGFEQREQQNEALVKAEQEKADAKKHNIQAQLQTMELKAYEEHVNTLLKIIENDGVIQSTYPGIVASVTAISGTPVATVAAYIKPDSNTLSMTCTVSKQSAQYFKPGDTATLDFPGNQSESLQVPIQDIRPAAGEGDLVDVTIFMDKGKAEAGMSAKITAEKKTIQYDCVIPLDVLRSDDLGYFVLVIRQKKEGWGVKTYAERIDAKILEQASNLIAIEGTVNISDQCISASNKTLEAGDSVRVVDL
jgi:hypothetical protein